MKPDESVTSVERNGWFTLEYKTVHQFTLLQYMLNKTKELTNVFVFKKAQTMRILLFGSIEFISRILDDIYLNFK
jgi:hypothetical protein